MDSGERHCHVVDRRSGLPLYHPSLYLTTKVRPANSSATVQAAASHLVVFLRFLKSRNIDLEQRIFQLEFLTEHELDALRDFCQLKFRASTASETDVWVLALKKNKLSHQNVVQKNSQHSRLTTAALYIKWLSKHLLIDIRNEDAKKIDSVVGKIKALRPTNGSRNVLRKEDRALDELQVRTLLEVISLGSDINPFKPDVQRRNRLIVLLLLYCGIRAGELLSLRISDIKQTSLAGMDATLLIARRADEKSDPRIREPNAKTQDRRLPLRATLLKEIYDYIRLDRRHVPNARKNDFLFVTHKAGPTVGQPISISSYQKMMSVLASTAPPLSGLTGHMFRHTWNNHLSEKFDLVDERPTEKAKQDQEQVRSYLMGWKQGSGTSAIYNGRFITKKANQAALELQASSGTRKPENLDEK